MEMTAGQQWAVFRANLPRAPRSLVTLGAVDLVAAIAYLLSRFVSTDVYEQLLPYTGWWAFMLLWGPPGLAYSIITFRRLEAARGLVLLGGLCALSAVYHAYLLGRGFTNPYHSASPWLISWELALAAAQIIVGTSPRVQAYCRGEQ